MVSTSASTRERTKSALALQSEDPSLGVIAVCAKIARGDWAGPVRAAALSSFGVLAAAHVSDPNFVNSSHSLVIALVDDSFKDAHVPARIAAYHAVAKAGPADVVFRLLCAQIALETEWRVRVGAFEALDSMTLVGCADQLFTALCRDTSQVAIEDALSSGEFGGVLADGADDPNENVRVAALRAIKSLSETCSSIDILGEVSCLAIRALRVGSPAIRIEVLRLLAVGSHALPLNSECASEIAREMTHVDSAEEMELVCKLLRSRPCGSLRSFTTLLRTCEAALAHARISENFSRSKLLSMAKDDLVACNLAWAHVADLARQPSDRLIGNWG